MSTVHYQTWDTRQGNLPLLCSFTLSSLPSPPPSFPLQLSPLLPPSLSLPSPPPLLPLSPLLFLNSPSLYFSLPLLPPSHLFCHELEPLVLPDPLIGLSQNGVEWLACRSVERRHIRRHCKCCNFNLHRHTKTNTYVERIIARSKREEQKQNTRISQEISCVGTARRMTCEGYKFTTAIHQVEYEILVGPHVNMTNVLILAKTPQELEEPPTTYIS